MFTDPGEFHKYLLGLIGRHANDLSIILNSLGISSPPTPERLVYAYEKFPIRFTQLLAELDEDFMDPRLNYTAPSLDEIYGHTTAATTTAAPKQTVWQKVFAAGTKVINTAQAVKGALSSSTQAGTSPASLPEPDKKITTKKIVIIGGIIVVVLIITFVLIKKFKK